MKLEKKRKRKGLKKTPLFQDLAVNDKHMARINSNIKNK